MRVEWKGMKVNEKTKNYERFLEVRREMLATELNKFLNNLTVTEELETKVSIEDLISEGESNELEFKSTLRWDINLEKENKEREQDILKSVASFSNGEGGTLLMGVNDKGEILGLDQDYNILNGDKDKFELHLRNLINKNFGKIFATKGIKISFEIIGDNEICKIEIVKWDKPLYITLIDKNGGKSEKFYIRSGNTSQELGLKEISDYINSRFK